MVQFDYLLKTNEKKNMLCLKNKDATKNILPFPPQTKCFSIDTVDKLSNHYLFYDQKSLQRSAFFYAAAGQPAQTKCFSIDTVGRLSNQKSDIFARETFF